MTKLVRSKVPTWVLTSLSLTDSGTSLDVNKSIRVEFPCQQVDKEKPLKISLKGLDKVGCRVTWLD